MNPARNFEKCHTFYSIFPNFFLPVDTAVAAVGAAVDAAGAVVLAADIVDTVDFVAGIAAAGVADIGHVATDKSIINAILFVSTSTCRIINSK